MNTLNGKDTITGLSGDDSLNGGNGADTIIGVNLVTVPFHVTYTLSGQLLFDSELVNFSGYFSYESDTLDELLQSNAGRFRLSDWNIIVDINGGTQQLLFSAVDGGFASLTQGVNPTQLIFSNGLNTFGIDTSFAGADPNIAPIIPDGEPINFGFLEGADVPNGINDRVTSATGTFLLKDKIYLSSPGRNEIDTLTGGNGSDTFILGTSDSVFYNDGIPNTPGLEDYALITDFIPKIDTIQLHGQIEDYILGTSPLGQPNDTAIFLRDSSEYELIGVIQGVTGLSLNSAAFSFV